MSSELLPEGDDYSFKRLNEVDLGRHSTMRLMAHAGDKVWIGDIGNGVDPHTSLWLKNVEICGPMSLVRSYARACHEVMEAAYHFPDRRDLLLPRIKRRDPEGRRETPHPFLRRVG